MNPRVIRSRSDEASAELMKKNVLQTLYREHQHAVRCPSPLLVRRFFNYLLGFLFPEFSTRDYDSFEEFEAYYRELQRELLEILSKRRESDDDRDRELSRRFFSNLSELKKALKEDVEAMFRGDPAAQSREEVIRAYPGFYALASYRVAHWLYGEGVTLAARMITEHAHSKTGIDIHPAARIGHSFCIDHGTGIVIGETSRIGNNVKIYQGVTLGALSVRKEDAAIKRHPTIEDEVIIYAGSSILGGDTVVGRGSIIGGNVWLTRSVPADSKIYYKAQLTQDETEQQGELEP